MTKQAKTSYKRSVKPKRQQKRQLKRRDRDDAAIKEGEFHKLKRKLRIMENDRKNYSQDVNNILRKQGREIDMLGEENMRMHQSLSVAYGNYHLLKDKENTKYLKDLLEAREDYKRLIDIETNSAKELDIKIKNLESQLVDIKKSIGGEEQAFEKKISTNHYISKLENRLSKMTTDFCSQLHANHQMKDKIKVLVKEKTIYQNLYNQLTEQITTDKDKIMTVTQEASGHYEQRLEAMAKMRTLKDRSCKDESMFQAEMKILQRMIAHDTKLKNFMSSKENERLTYKAEEAEKRAKMSIKEKVLNEEGQHVQKMEKLFDDVKQVTGHTDLDRVVHEYTAKDDENFARFDYVSELNYCVERLREEIQQIKDNIQKVRQEDANTQTACDKDIAELKVKSEGLQQELESVEERLAVVDEKLEIVCGAIGLLFKRISNSTDQFKMVSLAFEDKVTTVNFKVYLGLIERRFLELICVLQFIGLHKDHQGNLLRAPRSIHRIRPRGPSKILLTAIEPPTMPTINTPKSAEENSTDDFLEDAEVPLEINLLREKAMKRIAKKEAEGLLNPPLFSQDKRRPKSKKRPTTN